MIKYDSIIRQRVGEALSRYAIGESYQDAVKLCESNNINVQEIVSEVKEDVSEVAVMAFTLGVAIAIKKETKLSSYVAIDIGEGIQLFCPPDSDAEKNEAGINFGFQISKKMKNVDDEEAMINYSEMLDFMDLTNQELTDMIILLSEKVVG